jgi:hypothetical protein
MLSNRQLWLISMNLISANWAQRGAEADLGDSWPGR